MLVGKSKRKFDQVNRMSIPTDYQELFVDSIVLVKSLYGEPCISIYPAEEWEQFRKRFSKNFKGLKQAQAERQLADKVEYACVDKAGRITIKDHLKEYAHLKDEVYCVGLGNRVELWNYDDWEAYISEDFDFSDVSYSDTDL